MKKIGFIIVFISIVIVGFWLIAVPESYIEDRIETSLMAYNMTVETEGLRKGFFYNLKADRVIVRNHAPDDSLRTLLILDNMHAKLDILSLLTVRPQLNFDCTVNHGRVSGSMRLPEQKTVSLNGTGISIDNLPVMNVLNIQGDGILSLRMVLIRGEGDVRFSIDNLSVRNAGFVNTVLPTDLFHAIKGAARVNNNRINIQSVAINGNGIYTRAKGMLQERTLNMDMEVMLDASFQPESLIRTMLAQYRISPGYYRIPIRYQLPAFF
jgi:type II secretion system protein N